ncbi:glycoside hydrolase family 15 protein [Vitiosangium sp. GDMCC 1.1324]|uniref:glycoside hydrolase family 15 protein n=1 Tax=Vitiosangium sp. (strain GDMCC 1.1324) TaxID=2138576 RepID=UPI000D354663|nr:glycoside hydrolase family 15 protein [Vitiosangium sp. GDMCC 1.1324]PTL78785.1 glycoside hydrolase family 15 protein [Vitiosangium sp. GDMCC 1.1324]
MRPARIHDYALIGDGHSTALVSRAGAIDWLCWPRFDSPSLFAAILDPEVGGTWRLHPVGPSRVTRRYVPDTNVLETRFDTDGGTLVVTDLMPLHEKHLAFTQPERELLRCVSCERGEVTLEVLYDPRPDYGRAKAQVKDGGNLGWRQEHDGWLYTLRTDVPLQPRPEGGLHGRLTLRAGQRVHFSLTATNDGPAVLPPVGRFSWGQVERTVKAWRGWVSRCRYAGPCREAVVRSALVLKLLTFGPSGGLVAAPTTSLPEVMGGQDNWDYRFCWVRDSAFTARALYGLGYEAEAEAFVSWLLRATWLTQPRMHVFYDVYGRLRTGEEELPHLRGYEGSRPVRVGNAAAIQLQLDSYGEAIDAVAQLARRGGHLDREELKMLKRFGEYVTKVWERPDEGIWEPRTGKREHTFSRLSCWAALDRLLELYGRGVFRNVRIPMERFQQARERLREEIETRGWNRRLHSYVRVLDGDEVDADLLLMAWYGFEDARSERMRSTYRRIEERLGAGDALLYRNENDIQEGSGAFGICSFWKVGFLAKGGGSFAEAERAFEKLLGLANDVGLFAEEVDAETGEARGNFPQAFTHVGLISAALELEEVRPWREPVWRTGREEGSEEARA